MIFTMTIIKNRNNSVERNNSAESIALGELYEMFPAFIAGDGIILIISGICGLAGVNADWRVLTGLLIGNAVAALNFYLIGATAGYVIRRKNVEKAKIFSGASYAARFIGMFIIFGLLIYAGVINPLTAFAPLFFPKLYYTLTALKGTKI